MQAEYLEAKRLLQNERYAEAEGAFAALSQDKIFGKYSGFYRAFSLYKSGNKKQAIVLWEALLQGSLDPKIKAETVFWLAYSCLESGLYAKGISYASNLTNETYNKQDEEDLLRVFLLGLTSEQLKSLFLNSKENKAMATLIVEKELSRPPGERDMVLVNEILESGITDIKEALNEDLPEIKRDRYRIAVLLPFMYDKSKPEWVLQNQLVTGLYQGMMLGQYFLDSTGVRVEVIPFDTRRDSLKTDEICKRLPTETDLIIGPLYPDPIQVVQTFSVENKINIVNPVSSNSDLTSLNSHSFLFKPSNETVAVSLAGYADTTFTNRNAMIFYENSQRDTIAASTYKAQIEQLGFNVVWYQEINKENAKQILDTITAQYTVYYTKAEADSILLLPGRFVKERRLRADEIRRLSDIAEGKRPQDSLFYLPVTIRESDNKEVTYYESQFYIKEDSIGHIFGASRSNALVNNLISAVETKGNNIGLLGYGEWIDFTMVSYNQLERIGVVMAHPDYFDPNSSNYLWFEREIRRKYFADPTIYQMIGFETMVQYGRLLNQYGKYFQNGIREGVVSPGVLFNGLSYGLNNDNQVVPLVRFENKRLTQINR